jgi:hypothetical protein
MSRIVKPHYPVSALPEDLRQGLDPTAEVTVIVDYGEEPAAPSSVRALFAARRPPFRSAEEIDREIRKQRDDWE